MKYIKNIGVSNKEDNQSEISDEIAKLWIKNGNTNIKDTPWPNLKIVPCFTVIGNPEEKSS